MIPLRMAGATAFFTTFALPAVLIILIQVFGLILSPRFMTRQLFNNLGEVVGKNTAVNYIKHFLMSGIFSKTGMKQHLGFSF